MHSTLSMSLIRCAAKKSHSKGDARPIEDQIPCKEKVPNSRRCITVTVNSVHDELGCLTRYSRVSWYPAVPHFLLSNASFARPSPPISKFMRTRSLRSQGSCCYRRVLIYSLRAVYRLLPLWTDEKKSVLDQSPR